MVMPREAGRIGCSGTDLGRAPTTVIRSRHGERTAGATLIGPTGLAMSAGRMILGDFNSVRTSRAYRLIAAHLRDVRTVVRPAGVFRTFPTRLPSLAVDHIFVNAALHPAKLSVHRTPLARIASDHCPLVAEWSMLGNRDIDGQTREGERAGAKRVNWAECASEVFDDLKIVRCPRSLAPPRHLPSMSSPIRSVGGMIRVGKVALPGNYLIYINL